MQTNGREGTYAKLSEFSKKSEEDITEQTEEVRRIVITNNWRVAQIHTIVAAYLRDVTADYYEKVRANVN